MGKLGLDTDKGLYLGIDFGTTNSVVSVFSYDDNQVYTVPIEGSNICPTVIAFDEDYEETGKLEKIFGLQAKEGAIIYPQSTVSSIKRMLTSDEAVVVTVEEETYEFQPVQIAGEIISYLKQQADMFIRETFGVISALNGCVITVPAISIDKQKKRMKEAAVLAGFNEADVHIRLEPAAAAISYAVEVKSDKKVLVYDFGGGTFDACVLSIEATDDEPHISILSTYGDNILGGNDIDKLIMDMIVGEFNELTNHSMDLFDDTKNDGLSKKQKMMARARLSQVATQTKERLSKASSAKVVLAPFIQEPTIVNINMELTVDGFLSHKRVYQLGDSDEVFQKMQGKHVLDLIHETIRCTDICLESGGLSVADIDEIFLVGGSSAIPIISKMVEERFGLKPFQSKVSPALSISQGAATYCKIINMPSDDAMTISQRTIHSLGLEMAGRKYLEIIPADKGIPDDGLHMTLEVPLQTNFDGLTSMVIVVYESILKIDQHSIHHVYDEGMRRLAGTTLHGIPKAPKGEEKVQVTFHLSKDYLLNVEAVSLGAAGVSTTLNVEALY